MNKPKWIEVPDWVTWMAQDFDGVWFGYDVKPDPLKDQWGSEEFVAFSPHKCILLERGAQNSKWRLTLEPRPK